MKKYAYLLLDKGTVVGVYTNETVADNITKRAKSETGKSLLKQKLQLDAPYEYLKLTKDENEAV